ncbi:MAG: amidohydrolase family protein, partial [Pseudarthrobacter sp.]
FGSDWPVSLTRPADYQDWITIVETALTGASAGERESVAEGTANRVYRLDRATEQVATQQEKD